MPNPAFAVAKKEIKKMQDRRKSCTLDGEVIEVKPVRYPVRLRQVTSIQDDAMRESVELEADGTLFETKDGFALKFMQEDEQPIDTTIKWSHDQVALNRKGPVSMHHVFILGQKTKSGYESQFGQMVMETETATIEMTEQRMQFQYDLMMNHQPVGLYTIELTWERSETHGI